MIDKPFAWPESSGVFNAPRTYVMTTTREGAALRVGADTVVVMTPLDLITHLEDPSAGVVTVVLTGHFANNPDVVVIDLESPSRDLLEQLFHVSRLVERPVATFFDLSETMVA